MYWSMVSWSHHHAPIDIREKLAFSSEQAREALSQFHSQFPETESVLLSTCNRVELYCGSTKENRLPSPDELGSFVSGYHGIAYEELREQATALHGQETIRHLFLVAASLDSMIVGETQILSQVRSAYELACDGETASALMHRAFQRATVVARRVANETDIHRRRISVPSVAVSEIATEFFDRFDDKRILLIGAGDMGTETLRYLKEAGAMRVRIANRNQQRANELAQTFNAQVVPWENLNKAISDSDLIISTTSAKEPILRLEDFKALRARKSHAVLILDLAVPRDFESAIGDQPDIYLFSVDDLQQVCDRNIQARQQQWPKAAEIVEQETQRFLAESVHHGSGQTIKQLRDQAQRVKDDELKRLLAKLNARGLDAESSKDIEQAFGRLVNKLLHPPLKSLRENADSSNHASLLDALRRLFQLKD